MIVVTKYKRPNLQVCLTLRYYATGSYMQVVGDLIGVHETTACRTTLRVTNALYGKITEWIKMPDQLYADQRRSSSMRCVAFQVSDCTLK